MKLASILITLVLVSTTQASAGGRVRLGGEYHSRDCVSLETEAHRRCHFVTTPTQQLRIRSSNSRARVVYSFLIPANGHIQEVRIGWYEPWGEEQCLGKTKKVERQARRVTVTASSGNRNRTSVCGIDFVALRFG